MERIINRTTQKKAGKTWETTHTDTNTEYVYDCLSHELIARYIHRATWVKSIRDRSNYDGTRTITVTYDNGYRSVYIIRS